MQQPLTTRQRAIFEFIAEEIRAKCVAPSLEEIARHFELSSLATVYKHLEALQHKGYIQRRYCRSRSITLVMDGTTCPTCGRACGCKAKDSAAA